VFLPWVESTIPLHIIPRRAAQLQHGKLRWDGVWVARRRDGHLLKKQGRDSRGPAAEWVRSWSGRISPNISSSEKRFAEHRRRLKWPPRPRHSVFILHLYDRAIPERCCAAWPWLHQGYSGAAGAARISRATPKANPTGLLLAKPNANILYATLGERAQAPVRTTRFNFDPSTFMRGTEPARRHGGANRRRRRFFSVAIPEELRRHPEALR